MPRVRGHPNHPRLRNGRGRMHKLRIRRPRQDRRHRTRVASLRRRTTRQTHPSRRTPHLHNPRQRTINNHRLAQPRHLRQKPHPRSTRPSLPPSQMAAPSQSLRRHRTKPSLRPIRTQQDERNPQPTQKHPRNRLSHLQKSRESPPHQRKKHTRSNRSRPVHGMPPMRSSPNPRRSRRIQHSQQKRDRTQLPIHGQRTQHIRTQ